MHDNVAAAFQIDDAGCCDLAFGVVELEKHVASSLTIMLTPESGFGT